MFKNINILLSITSILITIILIEIFLRFWGFRTFSFTATGDDKPMAMFEYNETLGWSPKTGNYKAVIENKNINYDFLKDSSRFNGIKDSDQKIIMIGGSFTMGHGVNNNETFSYLLQNEIDKHDIKNFGVSGYGTYQSYLNLEKIFLKNKNVKYVIYFFIEDHERRDNKQASWLEFLTMYSGENIALPFAKLDKNFNLKEFAPIKYTILPLSKHLVIITKLQKAIMKFNFLASNDSNIFLTKKIIDEMNLLSKSNNSKFIFVNLKSSKDKILKYSKFAEEKNIKFINCNLELTDQLSIDYHPNFEGHKIYSKCILKSYN